MIFIKAPAAFINGQINIRRFAFYPVRIIAVKLFKLGTAFARRQTFIIHYTAQLRSNTPLAAFRTEKHGKRRRDAVDTLSAEIILQDYLDRERRERADG